MVGLKALMRHVGTSTDVGFLERAWSCVHYAADVAAMNDDVREWNRLSALESAKKNAENGFYDVIRYGRREVGEWEEVQND